MSIIEKAVGWLAPTLCLSCNQEGAVLCEACSSSEIIPFGARCWRCGKLSEQAKTCARCRRPGSPRHVWITTDYENKAKELVRIYKFGHLRAAANVLANLMTETFLAFNSDERIQKAGYILVPIPTATSRIRERGFGHSELLAKHIARNLKLEKNNLLVRLGQHRQVGTKRADRLVQAQGNYDVRRPDQAAGRNIVLIDDVVTTGATLQAASEILKKVGAKQVDTLVFAKRL